MKSITQSLEIIGETRLALIRETLSPAEFNHFSEAIRIPTKTTFRVNTLKANKQKVMQDMQNNGIKLMDFEQIENSFIVLNANENKIAKTKSYQNGYLYMQGLSSQIPALMLDIKNNDLILDLAAAPGSKTTQLAARLHNQCIIHAVEPDFIRCELLKKNIHMQGATSISIFQQRGEVFLRDNHETYDAILLDAPCSGEGRFNSNDKNSYFFYKPKEVPQFAKLQKKLLRAALSSLKTGGNLVYSTCTLNYHENEEVLEEVTADFNCEIIPLSEDLYKLAEAKAIPQEHISRFRSDMKNCLKIIPSKRIEGFFIAKIKKN